MLRIIAPAASPRLDYVTAWLEEVWGISIVVQQADSEEAQSSGPCITYGAVAHPHAVLRIWDDGLLWEREFHTVAREQRAKAALDEGFNIRRYEDHDVPLASFDILSQIFYHLSRYEEYATDAADEHDRFPAVASVLNLCGVLRRPVLDEWLMTLKSSLSPYIRFPECTWSFQPTYDIDAAWAMRHKGFMRVTGQLLREVMQGKAGRAVAKAIALFQGLQDPHDAYDLLEALHGGEYPQAPHPRFFMLAADRRTPFDKNIPLSHPAMQALVRRLAGLGGIGLHPSYFATDEGIFRKEKQSLEAAAGAGTITHSRQHFMRLRMPGTYRMLLAQGITDDWTMGYGSHLGFRAGTGRSFPWYDLEAERATNLRIHPFCFMDSTAHYHERLTAEAAFTALGEMADRLRRCDSRLVTIFHNYSLGSDAEWRGWQEQYQRFAERWQQSL